MSNVGNYASVAGLLVLVASHFGLNILPSDAETIVGAVVIVYGLIHQHITHKNALAVAQGVK